jgi:hypothetical protein
VVKEVLQFNPGKEGRKAKEGRKEGEGRKDGR